MTRQSEDSPLWFQRLDWLPIVAWGVIWIALTLVDGLLSTAWVVSGALMLVNCVLTDAKKAKR